MGSLLPMRASSASMLVGLVLFLFLFVCKSVDGLGMNWGTMTSHRLPDKTIVRLLQNLGIQKVKLFDADPSVVKAFAGTGMELTVGIPNDMLEDMAFSERVARRWVRNNITKHLVRESSGVNIRYIAVGNEPFLKAYNGTFQSVTLPALKNVQEAIERAGIQHRVTLVVPLNADVLTTINNSGKPSQGIFRPDIERVMKTMVEFFDRHNAPFVINVYPFLSLEQDPHFPKGFAFFDDTENVLVDGRNVYTNVFDASYDLLVSALGRVGYPNMRIVVGEIGWPTDGNINANIPYAQRFNQQLIRHIASGRGTPLRPGPLEVYLFGLIDEDEKSILPGTFERHWGIYSYDGKPKYSLDISGRGAVNQNIMTISGVTYLPSRWCILNPDADDMSKLPDSVNYACTYADCTTLVYGGSCNHIGKTGNASYAFNSYYQMNNQHAKSCDFGGLAMITETDPSSGNCQFQVQITPWTGASWREHTTSALRVLVSAMIPVLLLVL